MVDRAHKDPRRARSALTNLVPTTTGSATAIMDIFPDLRGRLMGHAVRVPLLNASLTDCAFEMMQEITPEAVNDAFRAAEAGPMAGILGLEDRPLVSSDFLNERRSVVIDGPSTIVVQGTHLKLYAWYDNEYGYAVRLADIARMMAA
jgi:glyceraldehyde 3-phosphate dehydrogenase